MSPPSRPASSSSSASPETTGCLPAEDQSCFAVSAGTSPSRRIAERACCTSTSSSYIVVLGISFGSLLAILLVLCVIRWYLVQRSIRHDDASAATTAKKRSPDGLDADAITALPEFVVYRTGEEEECAVCLAVMADGEAARRLPRCMHVFHRSCVDVWLREHSTCPVCRAEVVVRPAAEKVSTSLALSSLPSPTRVDDEERDLEAQ